MGRRRHRVVLCLLALQPLNAAAITLSYGGRLTRADQGPVQGPVDLELRLYSSSNATSPSWTRTYDDVVLSDGVFQLSLEPAFADLGSPAAPAWIEIFDRDNGVTYPRQQLTTVAYAAAIPVDGTSVQFNSEGELTVIAAASTESSASSLMGNAVASTAPSNGQVLKWNGNAWAPAADADSNSGGTVTSIVAGAGLSGGTITATGTLSLASTLPAVDGGSLTNINAVKLQSRSVATTAPSNSQVLKWNSSASAWEPASDDGGVAGAISNGQNLGASSGATADVYSAISSSNMQFRRLKEGTGVDLTQNTDDVSIALAANSIDSSHLTSTAVTSGNIQDGTITGADLSASAALSVSSIAVAAQAGVALAPWGAAAGNTGEARFSELTANGAHYLALKAPDALVATVNFTLPNAAPTANGQVLAATTGGVMSWSALPTELPPNGSAGGDLTGSFPNPDIAANAVTTAEIAAGTVLDSDINGAAAIATSKLSGPVTSIASHGLGSLATLSAVGSTQITDDSVASGDIADGTIANIDIATTAAIATSKLSGPVTSIASHGLGSLATLSAVGSTQITDDSVASGDIADGTIANIDIATTAAIATSKLSGPVTAIASHGLGSLATLSAVGSTQITDDSVASGDIADGTIANIDIAGNAAIASSKIAFADDGISGAKIDGGTISNFASTGIDDNASATVMTLDSSGNVGIGTTNPDSALAINGTARNIAATLNSTSTINFAAGNLQYTNASCGAFVLHNAKNGGSYTLTVKGTTSTTCSFSAYSDAGTTSLTVHMPPGHGATTTGTHTMYGFLVVGTDIYLSWTPGY